MSMEADPYLLHRFALEIGGIEMAGFTEIAGLTVQTEVFEYKEGGLNGYSHKLPGRTTYTNVTLKRGACDSTELWDWHNRLVTKPAAKDEKKAVSIIQYDSQHQEVRRWNLSDAFPVKWVGPAFNSAASAVAIEALELAFAEFEVVSRRGAV